jgi:hypothetical protein
MDEYENPLDAMSTEMVQAYAKAACADLCEVGEIQQHQDLVARAQLIHAARMTRHRFKALYERSRLLREALDRFEQRRSAMRA